METHETLEMHERTFGAATTARRRSLLIVLLVYWLVAAFFVLTVWRQLSEVNFNLV